MHAARKANKTCMFIPCSLDSSCVSGFHSSLLLLEANVEFLRLLFIVCLVIFLLLRDILL